MKNSMTVSKKFVMRASDVIVAPPIKPIQPHEYHAPFISQGILHPHHPAHRPRNSLQIPNVDMNWMSPIRVLQPFTGTIGSPPAHMEIKDALPFRKLIINGVSYA